MKPSKLNRHLQVCARLVSEEKQGVDYLKLQLEKNGLHQTRSKRDVIFLSTMESNNLKQGILKIIFHWLLAM